VVNWQITATTVYCEAMADEVTLMVHKDWSVTCTGQRKSLENANAKKPLQACDVNSCPQIIRYLEHLRAEETPA
jgi:hypothetical protein